MAQRPHAAGLERHWLYICRLQHSALHTHPSTSTRTNNHKNNKNNNKNNNNNNNKFISFFHLPRSVASSLFKLHAWQSFYTTSLHVLFGLPLGLEPSTSYSIHFFTQPVSSFHNTCPYHRNLFCCSINIISSIPSLSINSLLGTASFTLTLHIHLTILISARWSATSFSFLTGTHPLEICKLHCGKQSDLYL